MNPDQTAQKGKFPEVFSITREGITVSFDGRQLSVDTGESVRVWKVIRNGLSSVFLSSRPEKANLLSPGAEECDWKMNVCGGPAELRSLTAIFREADECSSRHMEITVEFFYPKEKILLLYQIACFPKTSGFRTRIGLRPESPFPLELPREKIPLPGFITGSSESLMIRPESYRRLSFGYYCDSQHRYSMETPILREHRFPADIPRGTELYDNSNGLILTDSLGRSILLVKESHKCVNCPGIHTGDFLLRERKIFSTGLGFSEGKPSWFHRKEYSFAWAHWCIISEGDEDDAGISLKRFDRARYPFRPWRDRFISANTWGSRGGGEMSRSAAEQENIFREIDSCADLGIELLQIDDGWQFDPGGSDFANCKWNPSAVRIPGGWKEIHEYAKKKGVELGLWFPWEVGTEKILENMDAGGFRRIKLDFACLDTRNKLDEMMQRAETVVRHGGPNTGINWDITEAHPRIGFFFGREYGNIFLQNNEVSRNNGRSLEFIHYDPGVSLRQTWFLSKYMNLNQLQNTVQRVADSTRSNGYPQDYAFGIAMMGLPLFFMETQRFSTVEREQLRTLIGIYKKYRDRILQGYVSPVGEEPDGASWTGFQCECSATNGFLSIFREKENRETCAFFELKNLHGASLELYDLRKNSEMNIVNCTPNEKYIFHGLNPTEFSFYEYKLLQQGIF